MASTKVGKLTPTKPGAQVSTPMPKGTLKTPGGWKGVEAAKKMDVKKGGSK